MKKNLRWMLAAILVICGAMVMSLTSCIDNVDIPNENSDSPAKRISELKSQLQNSYLHYPIIVSDVMCGAFSFNLMTDGKASKMGFVSMPEWEKITEDFKPQVDSCDITWDVVPNYQGFSNDGLTGDALRITMKDELGQTEDVYYIIGNVGKDSIQLFVPSQYGPQDFSLWRFENNDNSSITEMTGTVGVVSSLMYNTMVAFAHQNAEELSKMSEEERMNFLEEYDLDELTDWIYDFDSDDASARRAARTASRAATRAEEQITPDYSRWMARIRDDVKLRDMVIPGSHDATTYGVSSIMKPFGQTQHLNLAKQWNSGARVFDLRVRNELTTIKLFHNFIPCNMFFTSVVRDLADLVKSHPTEGAIVILKGEGNDAGGKAIEVIKRIIQVKFPLLTSADLLFSTSPLDEPYTIKNANDALQKGCEVADYHPDMTMGDLRGKILVIERSDKDKSLLGGAYASDWADNQTLTRSDGTEPAVLRVQDHYGEDEEGSTAYLAEKEKRFNNLWDESEKATDKPTWYVHGASGYVWDEKPIPNYYVMAQSLYPKFVSKIGSHLGRGIILQDFTGVDKSEREYENMVRNIIVVKHAIGTVVKTFKTGWTVVKLFAQEVIDKIADTASSIWNWITSPFRARGYAQPMLQTAPADNNDDLYYLHGDELIKQCIDNNYRYGDRIK